MMLGTGGWELGRYIESLKGNPFNQAAAVLAAADPLLEQIRQEAQARYQKPVNAKVDPVWKAIPGYSGLAVDIDATYSRASSGPAGAPLQLVYKEVPPEINLEDLGPYPIYRGNPNKPMAAIMVNVAWGNEYLQDILITLDEEKVKATFFLDGSWLSKNEELAKEVMARGHELSNHAYSHPDMSRISRAAQQQQISRTEELLRSRLHVKNRWFAPPSGAFNQTTVEVAAAEGLKTILWTVDTVDWKKPAPEWIISKVSREAGPGSLILMHPTASSRDALKGMITALRKKGLALGTVTETLSPARFPEVEAGS
ncbi:polysaccharide deacetylase family protein [Paenibacillus tarimensis]|uniref:polysaccharide deacetylase family protein n=1 Tax=Paenibacillus tarimensis TaxID=416012 RepID=UPI0038B367D3